MDIFHYLAVPVLLGGQIADVFTTMKGIAAGKVESNPYLPSTVKAIAVVKGAGAIGGAAALDYVNNSNPKAAIITALIYGGVGFAAAIHNYKLKK